MFFNHKCHNCGMPVARRALKCLQCDITLRVQVEPVSYRHKCKREIIAIICVACSCLSFVLSLGVTGIYQEGGLLWGGGSLVLALLSIAWLRKLEQQQEDG